MHEALTTSAAAGERFVAFESLLVAMGCKGRATASADGRRMTVSVSATYEAFAT